MQLNLYRGGHGEPLLLIHGIGSRWQMWEPVLETLCASHEVIAIDLPGFGASPMPPPGTPPGPDSLIALVSEFLHEQGIERPHAAGNSLGGLIALEMARRDLVRSATALSPAGFATRAESVLSHGLLWTGVRIARRLDPGVEKWFRRPGLRAAAQRSFLARPADPPAAHAADNLRALARAPWFDATLPTIRPMHFGDGSQISVPVLIAWGDKDRVLLPRQAARAARAIPSARIVSLPDCGHVPTYDNPALVTRVLLEGAG